MKAQAQHRKSRRKQRGQAMVEYSVINYVLLMGLICLATAPIFKSTVPGGTVTRKNVIEMMLEAYQHYYDSYYLVLSMPYP